MKIIESLDKIVKTLEGSNDFDSIETAEKIVNLAKSTVMKAVEKLPESENLDEDGEKLKSYARRVDAESARVRHWIETEKAKAVKEEEEKDKENAVKYTQWLADIKTSGDLVPQITHEKLNSTQIRLFNILVRSIHKNHGEQPPAVFLRGPAGGGKTTIPRILAANLGIPFVKFDCGSVKDAKDFWGAPTLDTVDGKLCKVWEDSLLTQVMESEQWAVVLFDEVNRFIDPHAGQNALGPVLDGQGTIYANKMKVVKPRNNIYFSTANIGPEHTATSDIDAMFFSRHGMFIDVPQPGAKELIASLEMKERGEKYTHMIEERMTGMSKDEAMKVLTATAEAIDTLKDQNLSKNPGKPGRREFVNFAYLLKGCNNLIEAYSLVASCFTCRYHQSDASRVTTSMVFNNKGLPI